MSNILVQILTDRSQFPLQSATDYRQYRVRVSRQLFRTRKALGVQTNPRKGSVDKSSNQKNRLPFVPPASQDVKAKPELLKVLVCLAERSWASAMETMSVLDTNFSKSKKAHVRSKLAKAVKYIDATTGIYHQISSTSDSDDTYFGARQQLQLETYSLLLHGALAFQTKNFQKAITNYSLARVALESFSGTCDDSIVKDNIQDLISTVIDPSLVYSHYRLYKVRPLSAASLAVKVAKESWESPVIDYITKVDPAALDSSLAEASANNRLDVIKWRSHEAAIEDKELAATLFKSVSKDSALDKELSASRSSNKPLSSSFVDASMSLFDDVLQAWQDAHDMVRNNIDRLESSGKASHDQQVQDQYVVATYVGYHMLLRRIQRDSILLKRVESKTSAKSFASNKLSLDKTQEVVRFYDTILQSTNQLVNLSGVHSDKQLSTSLNALNAYYKAKRLLLLGSTYKQAGQLAEAFALYHKASQTLQDASQKIEVSFPYGVLDDEMYKTETAEAETKTLQLRAQLTLYQSAHSNQQGDKMDIDESEQDDSSVKHKSLKTMTSCVVDNLDKYALALQAVDQVAKNLVLLNDDQKVPFVKPVFFDIAFNYIGKSLTTEGAVEQEEEKAEASDSFENTKTQEPEEKKKGGFFRIWGR